MEDNDEKMLIVPPSIFQYLVEENEVEIKEMRKDSCLVLIPTPLQCQIGEYHLTGEMPPLPKNPVRGWVRIYKAKPMKRFN